MSLPNVLICGKMGSGKTSLRNLIMSIYPQYENRAFGDKVKDLAYDLFSMDKDKCKKDRDLLIAIGTKMREINPDVWANYVGNSIKPDDNIIIDDLRYENELKVIMELPKPWFIIKIKISPELQLKRLKKTYPETWETHWENTKHHSETATFPDLKYNLVLNMDLYERTFPNVKLFNDFYADIIRFELSNHNN
jgi:energy-coupling factor transporter ATP-binding protein EcfA2